MITLGWTDIPCQAHKGLCRAENKALQSGFLLLIQCRQRTPSEGSGLGFSIQLRIGSGKLMCPSFRKAASSAADKRAVLQCDRSSATTVSLDEHLGVQLVWMVAPNPAATTLAALITVVAHLSFLDLPLGRARVEAKLSTLQSSSWLTHLEGSMHRVAR